MFKHFECFEPEVYYGIIASIIVISFVTSLHKRTSKSFLTTFWSYLSVILSDYFSLKADTKISRLFTGLWLITCTILLAAFSGQLREFVLKPKPIYWIDSWDDLHEWKDMSIEMLPESEIQSFIATFPNDPKSQDFIKRNETKTFDKIDILTWKFDTKKLMDGRLALFYPHYMLQMIKNNLISHGFVEDIDFHLSKANESFPHYLLTYKLIFDDELAFKFDLV